MKKQRIVVIGSGFGGLGAAARLAASGHQVTLLEQLDELGGRGYVFEQDGFKFDAGPTIITAPWMFDDIWGKFGKRREDYVEFVKCGPFYRIFDSDHVPFDYNDDEMFILSEIDKRNPEDKRNYLNFVAMAKKIFEKGFVELADKPFLTIADMLRVAPDLIRLQSYKSVYQMAATYVQDDFLRQVFSFHPLLVGGNPFDTTSIYSMIHYLEREWGVWYAMGGTGALVDAFRRLLEEHGVDIQVNAQVERIDVAAGSDGKPRATGVTLADGCTFAADVVVSNADVAHTYTKMIDPAFRKRMTDARFQRTRYAMSLVVIYFGTKKRYAQEGKLAHHNILLGPRYKGLLDDIFHNKGKLADDFSLYLHMPTITDPTIAPAGHESFYVLSPVPNLKSGISWEAHAQPYRDAIMQHLENHYLPDLQANLVTERFVDPRYFADRLHAAQGSAFSVEPILTQSAWFRPHNRSEDIPNLYLVGAGTHPGAGLPGVLSSSTIAENLINAAS
ncbi:MAG: phytoene desaturase family protein [Trueperaceae bacterium]|nr:phytoene desaturase family protein [Trueperaceae bacterium]